MRKNRYQLGDWLELAVFGGNAHGTPTIPDDYPTAKIISAAGSVIATVKIPVVFKPSSTRYYFERRVFLGSDYAAGKYMIFYQYANSTVARTIHDAFEIVAGGNADGAVIGQAWHDVPEAKQVPYQLDGGRMLSRRFPRL